MSSDGTNTYTYDEENRLTTMTGGGSSATYQYDGLGRRLSKTVNGVVTNFIYDGDEIIEERDSTGTFVAHYVYGDGIDEVLSMKRGATNYYYFQDGLGSTTNIVNNAGTVIENYEYDAYGTPSIASTINNPIMFTGRWLDKESGNYDYRASSYSPKLGRFLQRDPVGYFDSMNLFSYTNNNPVNYVDPMGLWFVVDDVFTGPIDEILVFGTLYAAYQASKAGTKICSISTSSTNKKDNEGAYYRHYTSYEGLAGIKQSNEIWASVGGTYGAGVYLTHPVVPSFMVKPKSSQTYVDVWVPNTVRSNPSIWKSHKFTLENVYQAGNYPINNDPRHPPLFGPSK